MSEPTVPDPYAGRLSDDRGFIIIEVLVSALILVMVSLAVFSALDNADRAAGNQQRRSLAANFAQSELERIRSLPVEDIAAMRGSRVVTRDGIDYTITTTAKWVSDGDDEPECTSRTGGVDYMRTTVSIAWAGMGKAKPISITSLFTPTAGSGGDTGSLSVHLINRNGGPVANVPVTLDGPSTFNETTNKNGCVVFAFVPESLDYTVRFQRTGYVNEQSVQAVAEAATVTARETTKLQFLYDSGGYTKVNFVTQQSSNKNDPLVPSYPPSFQMYHNEQRTPGITTQIPQNADGARGTDRWGYPTSNVPWFPFTTPYSIYAGDCPKNGPSSLSNLSRLVNITPLATQTSQPVRMPGLGLTVRRGSSWSSSPVDPATDYVMIDAGCGVKWKKALNSSGNLVDPGVPYTDRLRICAFVGTGWNTKKIVYNNTVDTTAWTNSTEAWFSVPTLYQNLPAGQNTSNNANGAQTCFD